MTATILERVDPKSPWWPEHRSRYHFASTFAEGRSVLDIACGTTYGTNLLVDAGATTVTGVDNSPEALRDGAARDRKGISLLLGNGTDIPLRDGAVSLALSFETVEHIPDDHRFVHELRRVVSSGGRLILSTPNAMHTRARRGKGSAVNPFHVREYLPEELQALLEKDFRSVQLLGQRPTPQFRPCPYWEAPSVFGNDRLGRLHIALWKAHARLPGWARERLAQLMGRPSFMPGEHDFVFDEREVDSGHVLVALCDA